MTEADKLYNVVSTGTVLDGFDASTVRDRLMEVTRMQPAQADGLFGKPRIIKKGLDRAAADALCDRLASLGLAVKAVEVKPKPSDIPSGLALVDDEQVDSASGSDEMRCPRCNHLQPKSEQCVNCGVWFHKLEAEAGRPAPAPTPQPAVAAPVMAAAEAEVPVSPAASAAEQIPPAAIAAAVAAALLGAWLWQFVALNFDFEFGLIAWGIGGAVGFAAAALGSRGTAAGIVCAILAVFSIGLGKYWIFDSIVDDWQTTVTESEDGDVDMRAFYEEEQADAALFVAGSGSDSFTREFMVERGYSYETDPANVSSDELADFREYVEPGLRAMAEASPDYDQWRNNAVDALGEISTWAMVRESLGIIDIVFLLLGVATAYRLGSQSS